MIQTVIRVTLFTPIYAALRNLMFPNSIVCIFFPSIVIMELGIFFLIFSMAVLPELEDRMTSHYNRIAMCSKRMWLAQRIFLAHMPTCILDSMVTQRWTTI